MGQWGDSDPMAQQQIELSHVSDSLFNRDLFYICLFTCDNYMYPCSLCLIVFITSSFSSHPIFSKSTENIRLMIRSIKKSKQG